MRRSLLLALLALLVLAPAAEACSLAYQPFDQPTWDSAGDLRFVDGDRVVRVQDGRERTVERGFFLSYADGDGGLLVAGQEGLGADCSGVRWLRWQAGGATAWEQSGFSRVARVFPHEGGPLVAVEGGLSRWADGELQHTGWVLAATAYVEGVTADGGPVYRQGDEVIVGNLTVQVSSSDSYAVAHNATVTAIAVSGQGTARLILVSPDGAVDESSWEAERGQAAVAWTGAEWVVGAGGRAFLAAGGSVTDLGVEAVTVGARGPQPVAFQEDGYTVFAGGRAVERWTRSPDGTWTATMPPLTAAPTSVSATTSQTVAGAAPEVGDDGPRLFGRGVPSLPAAPLAAVLAALAGLAARRR